MSDLTINGVLAGLVFCVLVVRIAQLQLCGSKCARDRVTWHLWVVAHVATALGALGITLAALAGSRDGGHWAVPCLLAGMVLGQAVRAYRHHQRGNER